MANILIVGCGKLGRPLGLLLAAEGHNITGVRRTIPDDAETEIDWRSVNICQPDQVATLNMAPDLVVIILTPASRSPEGYHMIYQVGLENLLSHFRSLASHPGCLFVSATSVYAQQSGEWVDETSETAPHAYNGQSLLQAEKMIADFSLRATSIRFSGIYGAVRTRVIEKLKSASEIQQSPPSFTNRIHQTDCIRVLHHLSTLFLNGQKLAPVYVATDHDCAPKYDVMSWLAGRAGLIAPTPLVAAENADQNKRCRNDLLLSTGFELTYKSYRDGYGAMLANTQANAI